MDYSNSSDSDDEISAEGEKIILEALMKHCKQTESGNRIKAIKSQPDINSEGKKFKAVKTITENPPKKSVPITSKVHPKTNGRKSSLKDGRKSGKDYGFYKIKTHPY